MQTVELYDRLSTASRTLEKLDMLLDDLRSDFLEPIEVQYRGDKMLSLRMTLECESPRAVLRAELAGELLSEVMKALDELSGEIEKDLLQCGGQDAKLKGQAQNSSE